MKKSITISLGIILTLSGLSAVDIKITKELSSIVAEDKGNNIVIKRVQNPNSKLENAFKKIKKKCPPYCIQPINIGGVKTLGELEVLAFIKNMRESSGSLLIDARTRAWYKKGTIPTAINLPFSMLDKKGKYFNKILTLLGGRKIGDSWNFDNAQTLLIFGNGAWDEEATREIKNLLDVGYPKDKLLYYRSGMQMWNNLGLTIK